MIDLGAFHMCRFCLEFYLFFKLHLRYWKKQKGGLLNGTMIVSPIIVGLFKVELKVGRLHYYIRSIKLVMKSMFPKETLTL